LKRLAAAALLSLIAASAGASDDARPVSAGPDAFLHDLVRDVRAKLDAVIVARPPKLVPPKPIAVKWKLAKLGSFDLGAPLVTLTAADLQREGKSQLYAVTTRHVVDLSMRNKKLEEVMRLEIGGDPVVPMSRDVVGTAIVEGDDLVIGMSTFARSIRIAWGKKAFVAVAAHEPPFLLCPGETAELAPGRNYFGDATTGYYGVRCRSGLVEPDGRAMRVRAQLSLANKLQIAVERCVADNLGCQPLTKYEYGGVGVAFEIADVDRDGKPEAIYAGAGAPGDPDVLKIVTLGDDDKKKPKLRKAFTAGGVAAIAVGDIDGNGTPDVIAAVRIAGSTRVDLWRVE
jgi:hypothetical protein